MWRVARGSFFERDTGPLRRACGPALLIIFLLVSALGAGAAEPPCEWKDVGRIVAIGDLHGDWDNFVLIIKGTGLVDERLHWTGGTTHLVQLGDIMDRGPDARKIFDRLMKLETEAARAGGMVHVLLGNHEEMNITGISLEYPDYVTVEQFLSFLPDYYRKLREKKYFEATRGPGTPLTVATAADITTDKGLRDFWEEAIRSDNEARAAYVQGFNVKYGNWLMNRNTVIRINDIIFVHGGISEKLSTTPLPEINRQMRRELREYRSRMARPRRYPAVFRPRFIYDPDSPLWFRGFATRNESRAQGEVDRILSNLKARTIVIGHNYMQRSGSSPIVSLDLVARFKNKVFMMDTGISRSYAGAVSALIIAGNGFSLWSASEEAAARAEIPVADQGKARAPVGDLETFLNEAAVVGIDRTSQGGRTEPWTVKLSMNGRRGKAVFRYIDRRRPTLLPDSWKYEMAASKLGHYLGVDIVPATVERTIAGQRGALQAFVEDPISLADAYEQKPELLTVVSIAKAIETIKVFDLLTGDLCLRRSDILIDIHSGTAFRVDFTQAFSPEKDLSATCEIRGCSRVLYQGLKGWDHDAVYSLLHNYLNDAEISALTRRRGLLVDRLEAEIASLGEKAVIYD